VIVLDASILIEVLLQTNDGRDIAERLLEPRESLHAPHLIDVEVAQVLRRFVLRGEVYPERARQALDVLEVFPLTRYAHEPLLGRIWDLRANLTAYDAAYVALAEGLRARLLTRDRRLVGAPGVTASVEVV
jgi:predicted nucleic acid-binding protein